MNEFIVILDPHLDGIKEVSDRIKSMFDASRDIVTNAFAVYSDLDFEAVSLEIRKICGIDETVFVAESIESFMNGDPIE